MCKLIKFKKDFFEIDVKNRREGDKRETTIEREYTTLRFNFLDLSREEKKEFFFTVNNLKNKFIKERRDLSKSLKKEREESIYFNLLSIFAIKHIINKIIPNSCFLSENKSYLVFKNNQKEITIKVHSLFIIRETLFGLYADRNFFRKDTIVSKKDKSVFNVLGDEVGREEIDIHFTVFYDAINLKSGDYKTFKSLYINEDVNSEERRKEFHIIGFSYKNDIKSYQQTKEIENKVYYGREEKEERKGRIYNVAPIFHIKDFSEFLEIFCNKYKVGNPYKNYKIEDFEIEEKSDKKEKEDKKKKKYSYNPDKYYEGYYSYSNPLDIEFSRNYDVPENPYGMSAEEYYWHLESYDPD